MVLAATAARVPVFCYGFFGKAAKRIDEEIIDLYIYMIVNKSWWDTVDYIAANLVGSYLNQFPDRIIELSSEWMDSNNMWLQRTSLLFQLKYKSASDTELMHNYISKLAVSKEFFLRKAIGWVLREYSKTNAEFVIDYVKKYPMSGLSQREALKWLNSRK